MPPAAAASDMSSCIVYGPDAAMLTGAKRSWPARANCRTAVDVWVDVHGQASSDQRCYGSPELCDLHRFTKRSRTDGNVQRLEVFESACGEAPTSGAPSHSSSSAVSAAQPSRGWSTGVHSSSFCVDARLLERAGRVCHWFSHALTNSEPAFPTGQLPGTSPEAPGYRCGIVTTSSSGATVGEYCVAGSSWRFAGIRASSCRDEKTLAPARHGQLPASTAHLCAPLGRPEALQTQGPAVPNVHGGVLPAPHGCSGGKGPSDGDCAVQQLTTAELAALTRSSEAALRRGLEACHQSFLQHQRQQQPASAAAQAWCRRPLLLGPPSASAASCAASGANSLPFARASSHSSSGGSCSSNRSGSSVAPAMDGGFDVASCGSAVCGRLYATGGSGSSHSSPLPVAPPTPPHLFDLANAPRECILLTCRGLCLSADTTGRLALHIWTRVEGMARLLLSVRPDAAANPSAAYGAWGAAPAAAGLQVFAVAAVWVASKLEERRQEVPGSGALAVAARSSPAALAAAELRILQWCDWAPYAGFVPDESHLLTWGP